MYVKHFHLECATLKDELNQQSLHHASVVATLERQISQLDQRGADLKMQIVEFELEKVASHQEHDIQTKKLQTKLLQLENSINADSANWSDQVKKLEAEIEEVLETVWTFINLCPCASLEGKVYY